MNTPRVSAIMPLRGLHRSTYALQAIRSFTEQTYENKELIILDEKEDPTFMFYRPEKGTRNIQYFRWDRPPLSIPAKRNVCAEFATGEIIVHWDSDDWSAPTRIEDQVKRLLKSEKQVTGYNAMLFYDVPRKRLFRYRGHIPTYAVGTSLMYFRSWREKNPFPLYKAHDGTPLLIGEDNEFVSRAAKSNQICCADAGTLMVARVHSGNTCPKDMTAHNFLSLDVAQTPVGFPI